MLVKPGVLEDIRRLLPGEFFRNLRVNLDRFCPIVHIISRHLEQGPFFSFHFFNFSLVFFTHPLPRDSLADKIFLLFFLPYLEVVLCEAGATPHLLMVGDKAHLLTRGGRCHEHLEYLICAQV